MIARRGRGAFGGSRRGARIAWVASGLIAMAFLGFIGSSGGTATVGTGSLRPLEIGSEVGPSSVGFTVTVIPPLPGDLVTIPWGINSWGDVVGWSWSGQRARPFVFTDGSGTQPLPTLPGRPNGTARDINDAGQIVGSVWAETISQPGHAVRWTGATILDLGTLGGSTSEALGVNATGAVAGTSINSTGHTHGFLFTDSGGIFDVTPDNDTGTAYDINDAGQLTGYRTGFGGFHAYRWSAGVGQNLGTLAGFANGYGFAINAVGQVAGSALSASANSERFIRFTDGRGWENLGGAGEHNMAWGINRTGAVVGNGIPGTGLRRAVLFTDAAGLQDLNLLIDPALRLFLIEAHDVNDAGQIVGYGFDNIAARDVGVLLTPVASPPPDPVPADIRQAEGRMNATLNATIVLGTNEPGREPVSAVVAGFPPAAAVSATPLIVGIDSDGT